MKIGILEISPRGHYTLVDSVVRIFASDKSNQIYICAHKNGENILEPLKTLFDGQIISIYWHPDTPLRLFFESINEIYLDRLYIITLDKYHKEFYSFKFNCQINIFIHNIDEWFNTSISYIFYHLFNHFVNLDSFLFKLKKNTIYSYYKRRIRKRLSETGGKFVVLSSILKKELITFIPEHSIDVIPFSVYDPTLKDESKNNTSLRICLPGMVSEFRRDYYSIIKILLENITDFRNKIEIVLLGFISKKEFGFRVIKEFQKLIDEGLTVAYFDQDFIPIDLYDHELSKADIILGNIITSIDAYSKYGKTKETGVPFTMIRAGKPGILPAEYNLIKEIESSTIQFENYDELKDILIDLINNRDKLIFLKEEALKNSLKFEPEKLYHELMIKQLRNNLM